MNTHQGREAITDKTQPPLSEVETRIEELYCADGSMRQGWLHDHDWVVVPLAGDLEETRLSGPVAAVARGQGQKWFISCLPPGARSTDSQRNPLPTCYRAKVSDGGLMEVIADWVPLMEFVITTEARTFAMASQQGGWHLLAGPRRLVEQIIGYPVSRAWETFGSEENGPFHPLDIPGIQSDLRPYIAFGGSATAPVFGDR